jgi:hypothetical protein
MAVAMEFSFFEPENLLFDKWIRKGGEEGGEGHGLGRF